MPRLDILLAHNLAISRSTVARLLRAGRVTDAEGARLDDGRVQIPPSALPRLVRVDGAPLELRHRMDLLQHKPIGVITALSDARHPTAYALLQGAPLASELRAVGRLDLDSSGLLLWTTDGTLLHRLTHPRYAIERTYHVALAGPWREAPPDFALSDGHRPNIVQLQPRAREQMHPGLTAVDNARVWAEITVTSGRFHEVRRIFAELDSLVLALCRVRFGSVLLPQTLAAGAWAPVDLHAHFSGIAPQI